MTQLWPGLLPLALVSWLWARWLVRRKGDRAGRWRWVPAIAVAAPLVSLGGTVAMLVVAFQAVATADAAVKQSLLAERIADAMTITAAGMCAVAVLLVVWRSRPGASCGFPELGRLTDRRRR